MELYAIVRREGWRLPATSRRRRHARRPSATTRCRTTVRWIRSYVLARSRGPRDCSVYEHQSRRRFREHVLRADLPVTEIIPIADTVLVRPDPVPAG